MLRDLSQTATRRHVPDFSIYSPDIEARLQLAAPQFASRVLWSLPLCGSLFEKCRVEKDGSRLCCAQERVQVVQGLQRFSTLWLLANWFIKRRRKDSD